MTTTVNDDSVDREVIYALDFDGVLVDSAAETAQSGWKGCQILFGNQDWVQNVDNNNNNNENDNQDQQQQSSSSSMSIRNIIEKFVQVRPVLYVGWESIIICQLLADPALGFPSVEELLRNFHGNGNNNDDDNDSLKRKAMDHSGLDETAYHNAMKEARDTWIRQNNGQDWIEAHGFFNGACQAVRGFLQQQQQQHDESNNKSPINSRVYVITTKAKDFALRLLEQERLYDSNHPTDPNKIIESHIFGLGSGSKDSVLSKILDHHDDERERREQRMEQHQKCGENDDQVESITKSNSTAPAIAIMVEDNIATLQKIVSSPTIGSRVIPVVASWGYNTPDQLRTAEQDQYVMLSEEDSGNSLRQVLNDDRVRVLYLKRT